MFRKILDGYKKIFSSSMKVIMLLLLCVALGAAFVFPLYKFATIFPFAYSVSVVVLIAAALGLYIYKSVRKHGVKPALNFFARLTVVIGGICLCFSLVFAGKRFIAIPVLVLMIFLYGFFAFVSKNTKRSSSLKSESENED